MSQIDPQILKAIPAVVTGVTSIVSVIYNLKQAHDKSVLERGIVEPVRIESSESRNSIVLLGLGGSGKTSLIKEVFKQEGATPERATSKYEIYKSSYSVNDHKYNFFISDYVGQNLGSLVGAFIEQQKIAYSEMTYGYINSLVLMVDLFPPKAKKSDMDLVPVPLPNMERVERHLQEWNETAIDAVFGLLTVPELSYVCLFINKYDLITDHSAESKSKIDRLYEKLFNYLSKKVSGQDVECEMIVGSASGGTFGGTGLPHLLEKFIKHSAPAKRSVQKR